MIKRIDLMHPAGAAKVIEISQFTAMDGWRLQEEFIRFALTDDKKIKRDYVFDVLRYAKVIQKDGGTLPLSTDALVNNHIGSADNMKMVFEEILALNQIDPQTHAKRLHYWAEAGGEMASSFLAAVLTSDLVRKFLRESEWKAQLALATKK